MASASGGRRGAYPAGRRAGKAVGASDGCAKGVPRCPSWDCTPGLDEAARTTAPFLPASSILGLVAALMVVHVAAARLIEEN